MTIRKKMKALLFEHGMLEEDAENVLRLAEDDPSMESMKARWNDAECYPPQMFAVWWVSLKAVAVKWIDANMPQAWYRAMFAEGSTPAPALDETEE